MDDFLKLVESKMDSYRQNSEAALKNKQHNVAFEQNQRFLAMYELLVELKKQRAGETE